ncbi:MAG: DUF6036 family nucleotidyltransferase [Rhodococcus sp. (in: high G+C Gram-positive bacteria)]|uniref:DUF6036 family nucleotidyltransferase n=1 Tax=Rhodococcus sp. TaxID=1831 RepID=UPI002ADAF736|nr:DUF6036 family nucleotidyltransferase [Rhodococcus sp. (in: high G+C Gram-positive bacteria)]
MDQVLGESANKGFTGIRAALVAIIERIAQDVPDVPEPVKMYLAGGVAVNFYTGSRPTRDVDASFSRRLLLPPFNELVVPYTGPDGEVRSLYLDLNYNTSFAVVHEDAELDSWLVQGAQFENRKIELRVFAPVDLAVSKLARFADNDQADIAALARERLFSPKQLKDRADDALRYYVGRVAPVEFNLRDAIRIVRDAQREARKGSRDHGHER